LYRNNDGFFFFFSPFLKEKLVYGGGFGALLFLAVLRLVFIRGEGYAGPPYSCLNKSKKKRRRSWLGSVFGVILQQFQSCQITCFSAFIGVQ
jgi:hypothetical protein